LAICAVREHRRSSVASATKLAALGADGMRCNGCTVATIAPVGMMLKRETMSDKRLLAIGFALGQAYQISLSRSVNARLERVFSTRIAQRVLV
jgi:hypothetical protein